MGTKNPDEGDHHYEEGEREQRYGCSCEALRAFMPERSLFLREKIVTGGGGGERVGRGGVRAR